MPTGLGTDLTHDSNKTASLSAHLGGNFHTRLHSYPKAQASHALLSLPGPSPPEAESAPTVPKAFFKWLPGDTSMSFHFLGVSPFHLLVQPFKDTEKQFGFVDP